MKTIRIDIDAGYYECGKCRFLQKSQSAMFTMSISCTAFGKQTKRLSSLRNEAQRSGECRSAELQETP